MPILRWGNLYKAASQELQSLKLTRGSLVVVADEHGLAEHLGVGH